MFQSTILFTKFPFYKGKFCGMVKCNLPQSKSGISNFEYRNYFYVNIYISTSLFKIVIHFAQSLIHK
uniref:Ovule protein n=1 Tax=Strongyloides venezuelensis TaxID=75913 RepID=A0A0K0F6F8_STRVS